MGPEIRRADTWSFNGGREIIESKELKQELPAIAESYIDHGDRNQYPGERRELLDPLDWEQEITMKFETSVTFAVPLNTDHPIQSPEIP